MRDGQKQEPLQIYAYSHHKLKVYRNLKCFVV